MDETRAVALKQAIELNEQVGERRAWCHPSATKEVLADAEVFLAWLRGPTVFKLVAGPVFSQTTGQPTGFTPIEGVPVQIHDDEKFDLTLVETDSKGQPTTSATPPVWTSSDEAVVPVNVSADGMTFSVVAGTVGSAIVQVDVTKDDGSVISVTEAVDVVAGGVALVSLTEGPVSKQ